MREKMMKKLGMRGLILVGIFFIVGLACLFAYDLKAGLAALGAGGMLPVVFGAVTGIVTSPLKDTKTLAYTHNAAVAVNEVIALSNGILVAVNAADANKAGVYVWAGTVTLPKKAALALDVHNIVYWDSTPGEITNVSSDGVMCGFVIAKALAADTTVEIFLFPDLTNVGTAEIANGAVTSAKLAANTIQYATVNLTNANIKNLRATPITLVAAPGANKVIEFVSLSLKLVAGANVLTENADNMAVKYNDGSGAAVSQAIEATGFIDQAANTITSGLPKIDAIAALANAANKALVLHNTGDEEYAGNAANDATMVAYIAYRVHDVS